MRIKSLDVLRSIAVILVIARHSNLNFLLTKFGWLGVDLFFVLSGFIVSDIIFKEYKTYGKIDIKRFLIRRALKIFPPFYFYVFFSVFYSLLIDKENIPISRILTELFYVQNYLPRIWLHTWSLAVEEQFYLLFSVIMLVINSNKKTIKKSVIIAFFLLLLCVLFLLRLHKSLPHMNDGFYGFFETHVRLDGIVVGVFLAYLIHFTTFTGQFLKFKHLGYVICIVFILPGALFEGGTFVMNTIGLTVVNLGFGLLVFYTLDIDLTAIKNNFFSTLLNAFAFIGLNSYSIYLWHLHTKTFVYFMFDFNEKIMTIIYTSFSIIFGIIMSYLIEKFFIKLRDNYFENKPTFL